MSTSLLSRSILLVAMVSPVLAAQQTATILSIKDNTLYEDANGTLSNGAGAGIFAGQNNGLFSPVIIRRGLVAFGVGAAIPVGSSVVSVQLKLKLVASNAPAVPVTLHRVLADWGESSSVAFVGGGGGGPAQPGDATWLHTFSPGSTWSNPGGDFVSAASAIQSVGNVTGTDIIWTSTPQLVADVQAWVDAPGNDFGWLLKAPEGSGTSAKKFDSREGFFPPEVTVTYTAPAATASAIATGTGCPGPNGGPFTLATNSLPTLPNIGFAVTVANGHPGGQASFYLAQGLAAAPVLYPSTACFVFIDPVSAVALIAAGLSPVGPIPLDGAGNGSLPVPIPNAPSLAGQTYHLQALSTGTAGLATSNALTLVLN